MDLGSLTGCEQTPRHHSSNEFTFYWTRWNALLAATFAVNCSSPFWSVYSWEWVWCLYSPAMPYFWECWLLCSLLYLYSVHSSPGQPACSWPYHGDGYGVLVSWSTLSSFTSSRENWWGHVSSARPSDFIPSFHSPR